jgi:hypothetical protein
LRGFGRVWVAFEAVFQSGVRFPCSLCFALFFMFPSQCPLSLSLSSGFTLRPLREERDCAGARLTLNSLLARGTGCHSKVLLLGTNADGAWPAPRHRRAGPGEKLDVLCLQHRRAGPLSWRGYTDGWVKIDRDSFSQSSWRLGGPLL